MITAIGPVVQSAGSLAAQPESLPLNWDFWRTYLIDEVLRGNNVTDGKSALPPVAFTFFGTLVTFLITRGITRFIRHRSDSAVRSGTAAPAAGGVVRDIVIRGVHIHHQVFGIVLMALSGIVLVEVRPNAVGLAILATAFGVGIGLAFDEFALWLHLDDVYWRREGRKSIDAVAIVLVVNGVIAVIAGTVSDFVQLGPAIQVYGQGVRWFGIGIVAGTFAVGLVCLLKGKTITAGVGVAYVPLGFIGAVRLAKPDSWWARTCYRPGSSRARRSRERFGERYDARWDRIRNLVAGAPNRD